MQILLQKKVLSLLQKIYGAIGNEFWKNTKLYPLKIRMSYINYYCEKMTIKPVENMT